MKHTNRIFEKHTPHTIVTATAMVLALYAPYGANAAAVAQRGTTANRVGVSRANTSVAAANKVISTNAATAATSTAAVTEPAPVAATVDTTPAPAALPDAGAADTTPDFIIEDKTSQFDTVLDKQSQSNADAGASALADMIRSQRAALDAQDAVATATAAVANGQNACDGGLRKCMQQTCGNDFTKCSGDTDTTWGGKMDKCRRDLECTGEEYRMFAAEIKSDRDMNAQLASYTAILNCGNEYNNCIITECGATFGKCLGKSAGDSAIAKCEKIAKNCTQQDSGLAARVMNVFGELRVDAEKQVAIDEKKLQELQKQMETKCSLLGATLDRRTMDCVYTVNFYAGTYDTPYASKKLYAGSTFDCTQDWFGINATTFKENAYRLTRNQESATSAMLGSGVGMATGAITSGAISRAIDTTKAKNALKKAQKEAAQDDNDTESKEKESDDKDDKSSDNGGGKKGKLCYNAPNMNHVLAARYNDAGECIVEKCVAGGYEVKDNACVKTDDKKAKEAEKQKRKDQQHEEKMAKINTGTEKEKLKTISSTAKSLSEGASNVTGNAASVVSSVMSGGISDVAASVIK